MKHSFDVLDGLRGLAAIAVVLFHLRVLGHEPWSPEAGYLAVDLFFCLSGFVLAEAYSKRLDEGLAWPAFMQRRILRLWPLYAVGIGLAAAAALASPSAHGRVLSVLGADAAALAYVPAFRGDLYPMNIAAWSLLYELVANAAMAVAWRRLSDAVLLVIIALSAALLAGAILAHGSADFGARADEVPMTLARVGYAYFLGVLLWRRRLRITASPWLVFAALGAALYLHADHRAVLDVILVLLVLPLIVAAGAAARLGPRSRSVFTVLGAMSYALYAVHDVVVWPLASALQRYAGLHAHLILTLILLAALIPFSIGLNAVDVRLRRALERRLGRSSGEAAAARSGARDSGRPRGSTLGRGADVHDEERVLKEVDARR